MTQEADNFQNLNELNQFLLHFSKPHLTPKLKIESNQIEDLNINQYLKSWTKLKYQDQDFLVKINQNLEEIFGATIAQNITISHVDEKTIYLHPHHNRIIPVLKMNQGEIIKKINQLLASKFENLDFY